MPLFPCFVQPVFSQCIQFSIKLTQRRLFPCPSLDIRAVDCVSQSEEMTLNCQIWCSFVYSDSFIALYLHPPQTAQAKPNPESVSVPVKTHWQPQGYQHQSDLPDVISPFPLGGLPHNHMQSLSLLMANRTRLPGFLCLRGYERNMSRFSQSLLCCSAPFVYSFHRPRRPVLLRTWGYLAVTSIHLLNLKESSSDGHQHVLL